MRRSLLALVFLAALPSVAHAQRPFVGGDVDQDAILEALTERYPLRIRSVGSSSVTLRLDMSGSISAAYKPRTESHPWGWRAEIAAYRVARALGMDNVPPAIARRLPRRTVEARFEAEEEGEWEEIRQEIRWDNPGVVRGAMIYWIPRMRRSELDTWEGIEPVSRWLEADAPIPADGRAGDLSTLLAFDYLIGNWDRFSGGNVSQNDEGDRLFVRDHNVAFQSPLYDGRYTRLRDALVRVERFERGFVERLVALDEDSLRAEIGRDPENEIRPILGDEEIAEIMMRRRALLSYIGAQIALRGADAVLAWD